MEDTGDLNEDMKRHMGINECVSIDVTSAAKQCLLGLNPT